MILKEMKITALELEFVVGFRMQIIAWQRWTKLSKSLAKVQKAETDR